MSEAEKMEEITKADARALGLGSPALVNLFHPCFEWGDHIARMMASVTAKMERRRTFPGNLGAAVARPVWLGAYNFTTSY